MFCFVRSLWLPNREKTCLSDFLDHTDSSTGKGQQCLYEALSIRICEKILESSEQRRRKRERKQQLPLQQESRNRAMRLIDV